MFPNLAGPQALPRDNLLNSQTQASLTQNFQGIGLEMCF